MKTFCFACWIVAAGLVASAKAEVRRWTDTTGNYSIEATLIAFDDDQVVLERAEDNQLGIVAIDKLSAEDREYLESKEAVDMADEVSSALQKWTLRNGLQVTGRLVDYARREVTVKRRRGNIYVNGRRYENLPEVYQRIVLAIVGEAGNNVTDKELLTSWLASRSGGPVSFTVDGVILEFENGDEYPIPFFLFSQRDLQVLKPGWDRWVSALEQENYESQQDQAFQLQAAAARYHQDQRQRRQIARMQLDLQAVEAGITSVWEVTLYPGPRIAGPPLWVPVFARDSRTAVQQALARNPGYVAGPVRRVSHK